MNEDPPAPHGTPADLACAKINMLIATAAWQSSMASELLDGVVTFPTASLIAASDELSAATKRYTERLKAAC